MVGNTELSNTDFGGESIELFMDKLSEDLKPGVNLRYSVSLDEIDRFDGKFSLSILPDDYRPGIEDFGSLYFIPNDCGGMDFKGQLKIPIYRNEFFEGRFKLNAPFNEKYFCDVVHAIELDDRLNGDKIGIIGRDEVSSDELTREFYKLSDERVIELYEFAHTIVGNHVYNLHLNRDLVSLGEARLPLNSIFLKVLHNHGLYRNIGEVDSEIEDIVKRINSESVEETASVELTKFR